MAEPVHPVPLRKPFCWIFGEPVYLFHGQTGSELRKQRGLPTAQDLREQARKKIASEAAAAAAATAAAAELDNKNPGKLSGTAEEVKNLNPSASGTRDEIKGKFVLNQPCNDLSESSETAVDFLTPTADLSAATDTLSGTKTELKGNSVLKRPHKDLRESNVSMVEYPNLAAESSAATDIVTVTEAEFEGGSVCKRPRKDLS